MPKLLTAIAVLAALVLLGASAVMNFTFAASLARTPNEGLVLGVVSVGVDILKAVLAVALAHAACERRWGFFAAGSTAFVLFTALSLAAAFGFSATNRNAVTGERERQNGRLAAAQTKIVELRGRLKDLPAHRPLTIVDEALAVAKADARWTASRQCTAAQPPLREFCDGAGRLRTERAAALEAKRIEELLNAQEIEAERLRGNGSGQSVDPQATALARALGLEEAQIQRGLMALMAVVVEVGAGLGVWLALGAPPATKQQPVPMPEPAAKAIEAQPDPTIPEQLPPALPIAPPPEELRPGIAVSVRTLPARPVRRNGLKPPTESS